MDAETEDAADGGKLECVVLKICCVLKYNFGILKKTYLCIAILFCMHYVQLMMLF